MGTGPGAHLQHGVFQIFGRGRVQTGLARGEVIARMIDTFRAAHGLADDAVSADELARAEALALAKFATPAWTAIVP